MTNEYTKAVDFIRETLELCRPVWDAEEFPEIPPMLEHAQRVLITQPEYKGAVPRMN